MPQKFSNRYKFSLLLIFACLLSACDKNSEDYFILLPGDKTGLDFRNTLSQTTEFSFFDYPYFFNGGGLAAGDFNNDNKIDLFFTSNQGENKLFLNKGNLKFQDISIQAGIQDSSNWSTGVSVVDMNQDGLLDLYVNVVGDHKILKGTNKLFVCKEIKDGIPYYKDEAIAYDLDLSGFGTQSIFADFDRDGDLDMFQLNHSVHANGTFGKRSSFDSKRSRTAGDRYFVNNNGHFVDSTENSGINSTVLGYGLGVVAGDINNDGWPDIYVGNDFHENDYLYLNQKDGTFKEVLTEQMPHTSRFTMGVDMADFNNDGFNDVISLDMLAYDPVTLKSSLAQDNFDVYQFKKEFGYNDQFARNNLQLNNRNGTFSEIALFSDVSATDWSWAPLFFDFDNDGKKDLFVSNGIPRRMNDIDYINYMSSNEDQRKKTEMGMVDKEDLEIVNKMPEIKLPNQFFKNDGNLKFLNIEDKIARNKNSYSNGAIYADLDNDGDLDIVVNNINDKPFIYLNQSVDKCQNGNYIKLDLHGNKGNINALGSRVIITLTSNEKLSYEYFPVKGFQSSAQDKFHVSIGDTNLVANINLIWPDGKTQELNGLDFNRTHKIEYVDSLSDYNFSKLHVADYAYSITEIQDSLNLHAQHEENPFVEFIREPLMPHMVSAEGPGLAVGDINGDEKEDLFFGSSKRRISQVWFQRENGMFELTEQPIINNDSIFEDTDAVLSDIDNDGDLDLIVASGGNEYRGDAEYLFQRIYFNNGNGIFNQKYIFEKSGLTVSSVINADFNNDGYEDIFFAGRAITYNYGENPGSLLYLNNQNGTFDLANDEWAPFLNDLGMVTDATVADINDDGNQDIIITVEWGTVTALINDGNGFSQNSIGGQKGWWKYVHAADFDKDGDIDVIAGNTGTNTRFKPTIKTPINLYLGDFDDNGRVDPLLTYFLQGKEIPFATHAELLKQIPSLKKDWKYARDFAEADIKDIFDTDLQQVEKLSVNDFSSYYYSNNGDGSFKPILLPKELQLSSLHSSEIIKNSKTDRVSILTAGNFFQNNIEMGKYDASYGNILSFGKDGLPKVEKAKGLKLTGQVKHIKKIKIGQEFYYLVARNNEKLMLLAVEPNKNKADENL